MRARHFLPLTVFLAALAVSAPASATHAGAPAQRWTQQSSDPCQVMWRFKAVRQPWHRGQRAPLAIGDSTFINATGRLAELGFETDARGCRQFSGVLEVLRARRNRTIPSMVVVLVGTNGSITRREVGQALRILGPRRVLVLLTPRGDAGDSALVRALGKEHPRRVHVLDWAHYASAHGSWFGSGVHLSLPAGRRLAQYMASARRWMPTDPNLPCTVDAATSALGAGSGLVAGVPVCRDVTRDGLRDMTVPVRVAGAPEATSWRLYHQSSGAWRVRYADAGEHFTSRGIAAPFTLAPGAGRTLLLTGAATCDTCATGSTWQLQLVWHSDRFRTKRATLLAPVPAPAAAAF